MQDEAARRDSSTSLLREGHSELAAQKLRAGVRARFFDGARAHSARFMLSAGTAAASITTDQRYLDGALLPREPWREPTAEETALLIADETQTERTARESRSEVAIFRLPEVVVSPLMTVCRDCALYDAEPTFVSPVTDHPDWESALQGVVDHLRPYRPGARPIEAATLYRAEAKQPTVTKTDRGNPQREAFAGLHLDSWEGASLRERAKLRNRFCLNLGHAERYFLFVNLSLTDMMRTLGLADSDDLADLDLFAGHAFMRRFPDYPVVKVTLAPFEAYIAPTGNLVHDGAAPTQQPDVALHLLGHFSVPSQHEP